jgi:hypothetical protein
MATKKKLSKKLEAAIEKALAEAFADCELAPRHYVELMTCSSRDLGRHFKAMLADELWDRKHNPNLPRQVPTKP